MFDADITWGDINNHFRNKKGRETRSPVAPCIVYNFSEERGETTDSGAPNHTNAIRIIRLLQYTTVMNRLVGGHHGILGKRIHFSCLLAIEKIFSIEVFYLTGKFHLELFSIEVGN